MPRLSHAQVAAHARAAEREAERSATIDFIRDKIAEVEGLAKRGRITAHEASLLNRRLDAVADGLATGIHR